MNDTAGGAGQVTKSFFDDGIKRPDIEFWSPNVTTYMQTNTRCLMM